MRRISNFSDVEQALKPYIHLQNNLVGAYSLGRMKRFMELLDNPQLKYKIVHIAGTSGKTSTAYYTASFLKASGKKVGMTVSPHVDTINERLQIDLVPLEEAEYCKQFTKFIKLVETSDIQLTYFEVLVGFAYWYFAAAKVDYAVVEVGLGGLLDATNVVQRPDKICVITDIGLDHTNVLGKSVGEITAQKGGIIGPHNTVFMNLQEPEVNEVIEEITSQLQAELHQLLPQSLPRAASHLPLFQRRNWHLARQVYRYIAQRDGLAEVTDEQTIDTIIPARMETIQLGEKTLIIDGAHNEQKMAALVESLRLRYPRQPIAVLASFVKSQNARTKGALFELVPFADKLIITAFGGPQDGPKISVNPTKIAQYCHEKGYDNWQVITDPEEAFQQLLQQKQPILLVTGSFYLFNHIRPLVNKILQKQG